MLNTGMKRFKKSLVLLVLLLVPFINLGCPWAVAMPYLLQAAMTIGQAVYNHNAEMDMVDRTRGTPNQYVRHRGSYYVMNAPFTLRIDVKLYMQNPQLWSGLFGSQAQTTSGGQVAPQGTTGTQDIGGSGGGTIIIVPGHTANDPGQGSGGTTMGGQGSPSTGGIQGAQGSAPSVVQPQPPAQQGGTPTGPSSPAPSPAPSPEPSEPTARPMPIPNAPVEPEPTHSLPPVVEI